MKTADSSSAATRAAMLCAASMIANQVAAKATRDALFLSTFEVIDLPAMMIIAAALSILIGWLSSRAMVRLGPAVLVPLAFAASAALLLLEWGILALHRPIGAVIVYLHVAALGVLLISGFWSMVNECFDPRTAKRRVGRIAASATFGGLVGGVIAERIGAEAGVNAMFPMLIATHAIAGWSARGLRPPGGVVPLEPGDETASGYSILARVGYLRRLALFVLVGTVATALVDYTFKARASAAFQSGEDLLRFFAAFHASLGLLSFVIQAALSRLTLERLGLARTVSILPVVVGFGGVGALILPGLFMATVLRGLEAIMRHGLYRQAYELFYTPVARHQKRAVKGTVDVGIERLADIVGGLIIATVIWLAPGVVHSVLLSLVLGLVVLGVLIASRLHAGYVDSLQWSLRKRAVELDVEDVSDATTRRTLMMTVGYMPAVSSRPRVSSGAPPSVQEMVPLLQDDEVTVDVTRTLIEMGADATPVLRAVLNDADQPVAVRRRIPRIIAESPCQESVEGLLGALRDPRFEIRVQCGRALLRMRHRDSQLVFDRDRVTVALMRELRVDRRVWESRRQLAEEEESPVVDRLLQRRVSRSLDHVFTLLSLLYDREALRIALRGLHTKDDTMRGTALEYLESILPGEIRTALWPMIEDRRRTKPKARSREEILSSLYQAHPSIEMKIRDMSNQDE